MVLKFEVNALLEFIKGTCCPHYDEEPERKPTVRKFLMNQKVKNVYAADGGAALHVKNEPFHSCSIQKR